MSKQNTITKEDHQLACFVYTVKDIPPEAAHHISDLFHRVTYRALDELAGGLKR